MNLLSSQSSVVSKNPPAPGASAYMISSVVGIGIPFGILVIPAKAGIYSASHCERAAAGLDSRFRGNDCTWERHRLANDTITWFPVGRSTDDCGPTTDDFLSNFLLHHFPGDQLVFRMTLDDDLEKPPGLTAAGRGLLLRQPAL